MLLNTMFSCHFVDPVLGVELFFEKWGQQNNGALDISCTLVLGLRKLHTKPAWFVKKKKFVTEKNNF